MFYRRTLITFIASLAIFFSTSLILAAIKPTSSASVFMYRPVVSTSTQLGFNFQMATNLSESSYVVISMDPSMTVPGAVTPSDAKIKINNNDQIVGTSSAEDQFGYEINGSDVRVTLPTNVQIPSGSNWVITIGQEGGFLNPQATGSLLYLAKFYNADDEYIGGIQMASFIAPPLSVTANVDTADIRYRVVRILPELRVGPPQTNNSAKYFISLGYGDDFLDQNVFPATANLLREKVIIKDQDLSQIGPDGSDNSVRTLSWLIDASYDVGIKTDQHITRILRNVPMSRYTITELNFTDPLNGPNLGDQVLLAGDINNDGLTPDTLGDDVINSVDISKLIQVVDALDPTRNEYRANLNKDEAVNSVDLSIMLKNLDKQGDK